MCWWAAGSSKEEVLKLQAECRQEGAGLQQTALSYYWLVCSLMSAEWEGLLIHTIRESHWHGHNNNKCILNYLEAVPKTQRSKTRKKDLPGVWVSVFNTAGDRPSIKASWGLAAFSISCTRARWACADRGEYGSITCTQSLLYYTKIRPFLQLHWSAEFQCVSSCKTMIFFNEQ